LHEAQRRRLDYLSLNIGSDHDVLVFAKSSRPGFHHASGRHEAGSNFFYHVRDPWGSFAEYFCDMH
jgi:hypothetical protein